MVTARSDVDYKLPILFRAEPYDAWSWLTHVGNRSMVIESAIYDGERLLVAGAGRDGLRRPGDQQAGGAASRGARAAARGARPVTGR